MCRFGQKRNLRLNHSNSSEDICDICLIKKMIKIVLFQCRKNLHTWEIVMRGAHSLDILFIAKEINFIIMDQFRTQKIFKTKEV